MDKHQMTTQEIIRNCDELRGSKLDWKQVYVNLHASVQSNKYRIMRCNNTLFWYKLLDKGSAQMFIFNADTQRNFLKNFKEFANAMKSSGYHTVFGITTNPQLFTMISRMGIQIDVEDAGVDDQNRPLYKGVAHV